MKGNISKNTRIIQTLDAVLSLCQQIGKKTGIHSHIMMNAAGFQYTNVADTAYCEHCHLEVSHWTATMQPFSIHAERAPQCPFVVAVKQSDKSSFAMSLSFSTFTTSNLTTSDGAEEGQPVKRQKIEKTTISSGPLSLKETNSLRCARRRTFSHWPHQRSPSAIQMIEAGFFCCNVGDRVIYNDFVSDCDLFVACLILQNQIEYINGKKENIIIPSLEIRKIRERQQQQHQPGIVYYPINLCYYLKTDFRIGNPDISSSATISSNVSNIETVGLSSSSNSRKTTEAPMPTVSQQAHSTNTSSTNQVPQPNPPLDSTIPNACVLCRREEKRLACIPCGHLVVCVSCGNSIRSCPACRQEIEAFVRIYI
ncbi:unnamed protein product [Rotaria sp. Silwood2]|nr:unnamed protein product [Rotaria sp. Silwood2]CAF2782064.1 unnamed protein product [Rotaria sp. Silwood2]CAF3181350.1 unnamed protein product [Rotaria sp. Silwood2]CAF3885151.1 unnamed protein product [Rotaria sp. Silwood2]CAF4084426.1 unnamed protein product [Rotaria sp. Silwood2]